MKITIISVGKIKEAFYRDAVSEYRKRLSAFCKLDLIEVDDEKTPDKAGDEENKRIRDKEGERIRKYLDPHAYVIALAIHGKSYDSVALSRHMDELMLSGRSHIIFVIGGSLGLSEDVLRASDEQLSFSKLTFPHQLMRVILLEQLYRCFKISKGEPYHK
ncbi:MAG: 23S rRNA (pseudouridine(1915)-N(3))-methyltransferase RlmH [Lachnospiraceae bacterium]|nr:23S rRNA (pseudouridine(1915)-N(3))-methyltransferase RlmH [Lachnospiraceae bacterium]